jgi:hypothetical protein
MKEMKKEMKKKKMMAKKKMMMKEKDMKVGAAKHTKRSGGRGK